MVWMVFFVVSIEVQPDLALPGQQFAFSSTNSAIAGNLQENTMFELILMVQQYWKYTGITFHLLMSLTLYILNVYIKKSLFLVSVPFEDNVPRSWIIKEPSLLF